MFSRLPYNEIIISNMKVYTETDAGEDWESRRARLWDIGAMNMSK